MGVTMPTATDTVNVFAPVHPFRGRAHIVPPLTARTLCGMSTHETRPRMRVFGTAVRFGWHMSLRSYRSWRAFRSACLRCAHAQG